MDRSTLHSVFDEIDASFGEHLERARRFVRQPSISATGTGIPEMAALVAQEIQRLGGSAEVVSTDGHPVVWGEIQSGAPRTLIVYGMYDVQPVAGESWLVPPFDATVMAFEGYGECVVGRGIMNSKGPLAGTFSAIESLQRALGELPVNIKFVVEGEEELGSPSLPGFISSWRDRLASDGVFFPFFSQNRVGTVEFELGVKGLVFLDVSVRGGEWGGPRSRSIHGAYGAWLHNPAWTLVHALAGFITPDQTGSGVDGLYDHVAEPTEMDWRHLRHLAQTFDPSVYQRQQDVARFKHDATGAELLRRYLLEPSVNLDGVSAGEAGEGGKTVLPHEAVAKLDIRLVPDMEPERVVEALRRHLVKAGFPHVDVSVRTAYPWAKGSIDDAANSALLAAYRVLGHDPQIWPLGPGCAPLHLFTRELGIPVATGGLGHGGRQHTENEYATVEGMRLFEKSAVAFMLAFASQEPPADS